MKIYLTCSSAVTSKGVPAELQHTWANLVSLDDHDDLLLGANECPRYSLYEASLLHCLHVECMI